MGSPEIKFRAFFIFIISHNTTEYKGLAENTVQQNRKNT